MSNCCDDSSSIDQPLLRYNANSSECSTTSSVSYLDDTSESCCEVECRKLQKKYNHPDVCQFKSIITPLSELTPDNCKHPGPIAFRMRRKNKVVSLQWEPFSGKITTSGITHLSLVQTICNMPPYSVFGVYNIEHNGNLRQAPIEINPNNVKAQVLFYINSDGTATNVNANDSVNVKGGMVSWIVN
ncbi:MAG TPA: hypothetical protein VLG50_05150 [Candidatus Saccharimonadales bacterium]|nr:hypothetical protein [Candidatus Saccharimonadales bacterium]